MVSVIYPDTKLIDYNEFESKYDIHINIKTVFLSNKSYNQKYTMIKKYYQLIGIATIIATTSFTPINANNAIVADSITPQENATGEQQAKRRRRPMFDAQNPNVHDPVMAYENGKYYIFATGNGIQVMSSTDMKTWAPEKSVFDKAPQWATELIKGYWGHTWAPDIIYANGMWHLYYSCSTFGKNTSAIGLAVNKTLDPKSPDFKWEDRGLVISSEGGKNNWNAIDPNIIIDKKGTPWLNWGSFWDGIQLVKLQKDMQTPVSDKSKTISRRHDIRKSKRGGNPVEAPFIIKRGKYFYLLVSFDYCCKGLQSNYKVAVGRSKKVEGPYKDKEGNLMEYGGGTILAGPNEEYAGIGHCSAYEFNGKWYIVAHAYSKKHNGASKLYIKEMEFDKEGWPTIKE